MKNIQYPKSSLYLEPPETVATEIVQWTRKNIHDNELFSGTSDQPGGRENQIHITVLYGITGNQRGLIENTLKDMAPISITLGPIDLFITSQIYDVAVVRIVSDPLRELNELLRKQITNEDRYPEFQPHLTLAFTKKNACWRYFGKRPFDISFMCNKIVFSKDGVNHVLPMGAG